MSEPTTIEELVKEWTDSSVMAIEGENLLREGWKMVCSTPLPGGGVRMVWERKKARGEDGR